MKENINSDIEKKHASDTNDLDSITQPGAGSQISLYQEVDDVDDCPPSPRDNSRNSRNRNGKMKLCHGIKKDLRNRGWEHYLTDFQDVLNLKVLASILFMFFTSIGPAITFASVIQLETKDQIGSIEVLFSTAINGIFYALFAGQPLTILGVTGPVLILTISIYNISESWGLNFLPFYAWTQIWSAVMHLILAITNCSDVIRWVSRFTCEIFACLIAVIYIENGIEGIIRGFKDDYESGFFQFIMTIGTAWVSIRLSYARQFSIGNAYIRELIADYGPTVALVFFSAVPFFGHANDLSIEKVDVPNSFGTTSGRAWWVDLTDIPVWGVFAAILPGFILTVLFFFDHNISSAMAQMSEFKLKKASTFHWDIFILSFNILISGLLGLPPCCGLSPQAVLHTKSLILLDFTSETDGKPEIIKVYEQRVSNIMQSFLIGLMCFAPFLDVVSIIPHAALYGLFLYMGVASFDDNELCERVCLVATEPRLRKSINSFMQYVPFKDITLFTAMQILLFAAIFGIIHTPAKIAFPVLIAILVPYRKYIIPKYFSYDYLEYLDPISTEERVADDPVDLGFHFGEVNDVEIGFVGVEISKV